MVDAAQGQEHPSVPIRPLDLALLESEGAGSLLAVAREGRLARQTNGGHVRVELALIDEAVLALVGRAIQRRQNVTIVYPAPAGEVSVLLAAEILVRRLASREKSPSVGVVIGDTTQAMATWGELAVAAVGAREPLSGVFPALRALPDGRSPVLRRPFQGAIIGRRYGGWPVDVVVVDHLSGAVGDVDPGKPTIRVFADPLDPDLGRVDSTNDLVWGWSEADLKLLIDDSADRHGGPARPGVPFSVASERLRTMAGGVSVTIHIAHDPAAEKLIKELRDDLRTLADYAGPQRPIAVMRGIRVAWHHVGVLTTLPVRPSVFDRFGGVPPIAARATWTFEPEIAAWAKTMTGDMREVAEVVASDLGELRTCLEDSDPFRPQLAAWLADQSDGVVVVQTQTAAKALIEVMSGAPATGAVGRNRIVAMRRLHREGSFSRAIVVGTPSPWDWHRLDSGLSPEVHVLVLGERDAFADRRTVEALHSARGRWANREVKERTWRELVGTEPPQAPDVSAVGPTVNLVGALEPEPVVDPFDALQSLLTSTPLSIGDEGVEDVIAREGVDGWEGAVTAVQVVTDAGTIMLPRDRLVDVRSGAAIEECRAGSLAPGMLLLVDRHGNRVGLLEAVADTLKKRRPDLLVANLVITDLRSRVRRRFRDAGITQTELFERMKQRGFVKTIQALRGYVDDEGPLAPRDFDDLRRLNDSLEIGMDPQRLKEAFAGVQRWRVFKRVAGKALVAASRSSVVATEATAIEAETGLSVADLRELVLEAKVVEVKECPGLVALAEIGFLRSDALPSTDETSRNEGPDRP